ncbi:MAG: CCA tRNA nucleotidyltransferase [Eubacteriales bacterium]|nr:CCA tRNA nucleotidyltransferase [Eubacteriales bacterium]
MHIELPPQVEQIIERLAEHGYEAYAVGGCVRDTLLGRCPGDWDITTSARPEQIKALFRRTIDTGIQHGTVTVMMEGEGYEVTTYRIDGEYEDGRHPKQVKFTSDLLEDLRRRDFTINAMAYSHRTGIVDAFGGIEDLERKRIRCVGSAAERFEEDALRILRAIRFSAQLDFAVDEETWNAIKLIAPNLNKVSRERVQMELTKLLCSDHPERIGQVYETGMAPYVTPDFADLSWQTACFPKDSPRKKYVRWAAFLRCGRAALQADGRQLEAEPGGAEWERERAAFAVRILRDLKLDNDTIGKVRTLVAWSGVILPLEAPSVRRAMSRMEPEVWDSLAVLNGWGAELVEMAERIRRRGDCLSLKQLAVNGQDLIAEGIAPGREIGRILGVMFEEVLDHPEHNKKELLIPWYFSEKGRA